MSQRIQLCIQSGLFGAIVLLTIQVLTSDTPWDAPIVLAAGAAPGFFAWTHFQQVQDKPRTTESKVEV